MKEFRAFFEEYQAAWSRNDFEGMKRMISPDLQAREITARLDVIDFGYEGSLEGWKQGFAYFADKDMQWLFEEVAVLPLREREMTAIFWVWVRVDGVESDTAHLYVQTFRQEADSWQVVRSYIEASVPRGGATRCSPTYGCT